jgi:hypothetical protein
MTNNIWVLHGTELQLGRNVSRYNISVRCIGILQFDFYWFVGRLAALYKLIGLFGVERDDRMIIYGELDGNGQYAVVTYGIPLRGTGKKAQNI